ncbi:uncharacterized protein LOC127840750 [Dreissena polymorpha]|uniref:Uncharacterized protein n=1 Tax=Dreissena polymorpha TaxID=45954 RepID=A0A9D4RYB6_DREPO|nr:uncharacterized protein LOC127840750 [Dreissena polymorpha]KAH3885661.1 hypothetical protein DPMN_009656 [Dreissena polymorpha]
MDELFAGDLSVRPAMVVSSMPVQQDVTVTVTAKPPPGPRRPTVHKAPTPPPIDQPAGRATTPSTEGTDVVATPLIRKRKRSGSQDPPEWYRSYMLEHSQRLDRLDAHNERLTALVEQKNRLLERLVQALTSNKS